MRNHVVVIPVDSLISVDGEVAHPDFAPPKGLHAIQWHEGKGHIEYTDGRPNRMLAETDYETEVAPFVRYWENATKQELSGAEK